MSMVCIRYLEAESFAEMRRLRAKHKAEVLGVMLKRSVYESQQSSLLCMTPSACTSLFARSEISKKYCLILE